jgi:hypothetical protein
MRLVGLGIVVAVLTFVALWRVSSRFATGTPDRGAPPIARQTTLDGVRIREVPSRRTLLVGSADTPWFVVLDPDVKRSAEIALEPGARVTLIGLVRNMPPADTAMRQWELDAEGAARALTHAEYLYVTEIRAP